MWQAAQAGNNFDMIMVCPDEVSTLHPYRHVPLTHLVQEQDDYDACARAVPCPALAKDDPMIKNFIRWHKVQEVPCLCVISSDASEITKEGVVEMNPPPPTEG